MKIVIVGGGSAGWMSAATFMMDAEVTLVESPNIPTIGVGESTIVGLIKWMYLLGIDPDEVVRYTQGSYKLGIRFENFYKLGDGGFFYPFGTHSMNHDTLASWMSNRKNSFAEEFFVNMALIKANKFVRSKNECESHYALHFDAIKFAEWLREKHCKGKVTHILSEVKNVKTSDIGVSSIELENGQELTADLFIDCTGFKSLLLGETLKEPFESYKDVLPNNSAWVVQIPYKNKRKEMVNYTNCTALGNGWVWRVPLWSRIGTGYVYSNEFITDEEALQEFKNHLGKDSEKFTYRKLSMKTGCYKRPWVKNVVAIGLSAGFIEPLESTGLWTVHQFLLQLLYTVKRGTYNQWDRDVFNQQTRRDMQFWKEFIVLHYNLSARRDTPYWKSIAEKEYRSEYTDLPFALAAKFKMEGVNFEFAGLPCILFGMEYFPFFAQVRMDIEKSVYQTDDHVKRWNEAVKQLPTMFDYLQSLHC